jgi:UDP-N-acetylglucosamine acyltransferase
MAYTHVAHDCIIGDDNVFSNLASLAGHVIVGNHVGVGGMSGIHQFVHIGDYAYIGGGSMITQDVVPFVMVAGNRATVNGINKVGLQRRNFSRESMEIIKKIYDIFFKSGLTVKDAIEKIRKDLPDTEEVGIFLNFVENSSDRGFTRPNQKNI